MKVIHVDTIEIQVKDEQVVKMIECVTMNTKQEILIRNKKDTLKLSKQISESSKRSREERYLEAIENNDRLYLNSLYKSLSMLDLLKIFFQKTKRYL